jgi:hypothetical protein
MDQKFLINRKGLFSVFYIMSEKSSVSHSDMDIRKHQVFDAIRIGLIRLQQEPHEACPRTCPKTDKNINLDQI